MRMAKYDRLLFILNLLRTRRNLNAAMIADECGVTERTIYRDIISLSEANIPIYYDRGYKYASDNFLPPLNFTVEEYVILKSALKSSPLYRGGGTRRAILSILNKIEANLSDLVRSQKNYINPPADVRIKTTALYKGEKYFAAIEQGIKRNYIVRLTYDSIESGLTEREVEPYFMAFVEKAFYFVGYCLLRNDFRTFRIDRIVSVELTDKKFRQRKNLSPEEYFRNSWGVYSGDPIEVEVEFKGKAARIIKSSRHHEGEEIFRIDGDVVIYKVKVSGIEEICRWLLGFGGEARVISPEGLKRRLKRMANEALKAQR